MSGEGEKVRVVGSINYAKINNYMLHMRGHGSVGLFRCDVLFLQGKHNGFHRIVANA